MFRGILGIGVRDPKLTSFWGFSQPTGGWKVVMKIAYLEVQDT